MSEQLQLEGSPARIYVDQIQEYPIAAIQPAARRCGQWWCHLWTEPGNEEALHALAERIGMRRGWFQARRGFPHYDLTPNRRALAVRYGAVERDLMGWLRERRGKS